MSSHSRFSTLARAVAEGAHPSELLVELHRVAVASLHASASLILQRRGASGNYGVTSSANVDEPGGYWLDQVAAKRLQALVGESSTMCDAEVLGPIMGRLAGTEPLLVVPLRGSGPTAFLIVVAPALVRPKRRRRANRCACSSDSRWSLHASGAKPPCIARSRSCCFDFRAGSLPLSASPARSLRSRPKPTHCSAPSNRRCGSTTGATAN